jgi:hypothetical protein
MTQTLPTGPVRSRPAFSIPSILAIIAAVVSFRAGATLGLLCAITAIVLGLVGFLLALAPGTRGGIVSIISIVCGLIGIIAAVFKLIGGNF